MKKSSTYKKLLFIYNKDLKKLQEELGENSPLIKVRYMFISSDLAKDYWKLLEKYKINNNRVKWSPLIFRGAFLIPLY